MTLLCDILIILNLISVFLNVINVILCIKRIIDSKKIIEENSDELCNKKCFDKHNTHQKINDNFDSADIKPS